MNRPSIGQYLAGAFLGNAPLLFLDLALTFVDPVILSSLGVFLQIVVYSTMFIGGILAAFLVARIALSRYVTVGLTTGFFCSLVNLLLELSLFGSLFFAFYNGYLNVLLFVGGSAIGGLMRQLQVVRFRRKKTSTK